MGRRVEKEAAENGGGTKVVLPDLQLTETQIHEFREAFQLFDKVKLLHLGDSVLGSGERTMAPTCLVACS
jgi:Ca2+-binding EF-hand superfamily protein